MSVNFLLQPLPGALLPPQLPTPGEVADVQAALQGLSVVTAPGERHQLLSRTDAKFVLPRAHLPALLQSLQGLHAVLPAAGELLAGYATVYFDTEDQAMLRDHLRGKRPRHKVRVRHYLDRQLSYLEIKTKRSNGQTDKARQSRVFGDNELGAVDVQWIHAALGGLQPLTSQAWTACQRITLLGLEYPERMTIDVNISLGTAVGARSLQRSVIIELKRVDRMATSTVQLLRELGAKPVSFSKYVAAMLTAQPENTARFRAVQGSLVLPEQWEMCGA